MRALVVYESLWGNTAAVARAIAEGIGQGARAVSTSQASAELQDGVDLLVVGCPLLGFNVPTESMIKTIRGDVKHREHPPDTSHQAMKTWLASVPRGSGACAGFETRIWWSPGSAAKKITKALVGAGYRKAGEPQRFVVEGSYGPLREGELDRARAWGEALAKGA